MHSSDLVHYDRNLLEFPQGRSRLYLTHLNNPSLTNFNTKSDLEMCQSTIEYLEILIPNSKRLSIVPNHDYIMKASRQSYEANHLKSVYEDTLIPTTKDPQKTIESKC